MEPADGEAEDLALVEGGADDREAEVQRDRHRAEHGDGHAEAEADGNAIVLDLESAFNRARIEEGQRIEAVVGENGHLVLDAVEEHEVAAGLEPVDIRSDAAEGEAAQRLEA